MCRENKIVALVLAAGYSSRMGEFKPLMKLNGHSVIENAVGCFQNAGISDVRVVVGYRASEIIPLLDIPGVNYIINENYNDGMFTSVIAGLRNISGQASGFFLLPGDMPMVKSGTVKMILAEYMKSGSGIIYPCFLGRRGHPPFISNRYFEKILSSDLSDNLHSVLSRYDNDSIDLELIDQAILMDMDSPEDYHQAVSYLNHQNTLTDDECSAVFSIYKTPVHIIKHGEAVSEISRLMAELLNGSGRISLDVDLLKAGALLHDIARDKPDHAKAGAAILDQLGYPDIAKIISGHMDIDINRNNPVIDETAVVYLADKMVKEDILISLNEKFSEYYKKFYSDPEIIINIRKRENNALLIKEEIEKISGISDLDSFLNKAECRL